MRSTNDKPRKPIGRGKPNLTKKAQLIRMLSSKAGADVAAISKRLGWHDHTTRAVMSGLRKAGYQISSAKPENGKSRRYRITARPEPQSCAGAPSRTATKQEAAHAE